MFTGKLVFIEFTAENRVFTIVTEEWCTKDPSFAYHEYDVDYCDSHEHYHAHESGGAHFPRQMNNRVDAEHHHVPYNYWIAPHLRVEFYEGVDPAYCIPISATDLLPLILTNEDYREEFVATHPEPTVDALITYWYEHADGVEEGQVVYCSLCKCAYDYEALAPCPHIRWCDTCGDWSMPDGECEHRSEDDHYYIDPEEAQERSEQLSQL